MWSGVVSGLWSLAGPQVHTAPNQADFMALARLTLLQFGPISLIAGSCGSTRTRCQDALVLLRLRVRIAIEQTKNRYHDILQSE